MKIKEGDLVAYSIQFLKSICMSHSDMARARGTIKKIEKLGQKDLVTITWDDPDIPTKVIADNLAKVGPNTRFCEC